MPVAAGMPTGDPALREERAHKVNTTVQLLAAIYPDREHAKTIFDMLHQMHRATRIDLVDSALVTRSRDGKVKIEETKELTAAKGARRGAIITGVLGLIYPPSLIGSVLVGGAAGAIAGRARDTGIKHPQLQEIADRLEPGKAAVIALTGDASTVRVQGALEGYEGALIVRALDDEALKELYKAAGTGE